MRILLVLTALLAVTWCGPITAFSDDAPMPMNTDPAVLAGLETIIGDWEGSGTSTLGPFKCSWSAWREGAWIITTSAIFDVNDKPVDHITQLFGANPDGSLICYSFEASGMTVWNGAADGKGAKFTFAGDDEDPSASGSFAWENNADGSMTSHFKMHSTMHPEGWPDDFWVEETDRRAAP